MLHQERKCFKDCLCRDRPLTTDLTAFLYDNASAVYEGLEGASGGRDTCSTQAVVGAKIPGLSLPFTLKFREIFISSRLSGSQTHHVVEEKGKWFVCSYLFYWRGWKLRIQTISFKSSDFMFLMSSSACKAQGFGFCMCCFPKSWWKSVCTLGYGREGIGTFGSSSATTLVFKQGLCCSSQPLSNASSSIGMMQG